MPETPPETPQRRASEKACYAAALRMLTRRDHSRAELSKKLKAKGFSASDIHWAFERCQRYDYLDDERYAINIARQMQRRGYGVRRIRQSLLTKGVDGGITDRAIDLHCTHQRQLAQCHNVLRKKLKREKNARSVKPRLYRHLLGRGYLPSVAAAAMESAFEPDRP